MVKISWNLEGGMAADAGPCFFRLLAVNAISPVFALAANFALLLNVARRISFAGAQPITIVGWYISSFLLIAIVVAAPARLRLPSPPSHVFTQAFCFGMMAAVLYFIVASLMVITVYDAYQGRYSQELWDLAINCEFTVHFSERDVRSEFPCFWWDPVLFCSCSHPLLSRLLYSYQYESITERLALCLIEHPALLYIEDLTLNLQERKRNSLPSLKLIWVSPSLCRHTLSFCLQGGR